MLPYILAIAVGLGCSIGAYFLATRRFSRLVGNRETADPNTPVESLNTESIQSTLKGLVIATGLLYLCLAGGGAFVYSISETARSSLCALRADLETRTEDSKEFLKKNPEGIPGISRATIQQGIENQERTVEALSSLPCSSSSSDSSPPSSEPPQREDAPQ